MFVLLLMIFWVQNPMTFSASLRRALITMAILLAALIPTGVLDVGSLAGLPGQVDFVSAQSPFTNNTIGGNAFGRGGTDLTSGQNRTEPSQQDTTRYSSAPGKRLREGTLVPQTVGRLEMIGRRWMFVSHVNHDDGRSRNSKLPVDRSEVNQETSSSNGDGVFADGLLNRTTSLTYTEATADRRLSEVRRLPSLIIVENLMLQRIVEAIRQDSEDNRWEISGVVTEFFDENRLEILTAKRSAVPRGF